MSPTAAFVDQVGSQPAIGLLAVLLLAVTVTVLATQRRLREMA